MPKTGSIHSLTEIARNRRPHERRCFAKWSTFNVVKAMPQEFLGPADQKKRIGTSGGTQESTAKMVHCPEVDGNRFLIHRVVFAVALQLALHSSVTMSCDFPRTRRKRVPPVPQRNLVFIPARYFHNPGSGQRLRFQIGHKSPPRSKEQSIGRRRQRKPARHKHLNPAHPAMCAQKPQPFNCGPN